MTKDPQRLIEREISLMNTGFNDHEESGNMQTHTYSHFDNSEQPTHNNNNFRIRNIIQRKLILDKNYKRDNNSEKNR